ncbi:MAG: hypothetical protein J5922_00425 [Clostridia bacterium]|nr:hypothetical protein [Clostridia bacterium]
MRNKTVNQIVNDFRSKDPGTVINRTMLIRLMDDGVIPYEQHGNRIVCDLDTVLVILNDMLGLEPTESFLHLRSIEKAICGLKILHSELGVGEDRLRQLISEGRVPTIKIGNRNYIAMESFEPPYDCRFGTATYNSKNEKKQSNVKKQLAHYLNDSPRITVKRI